MGWVLLLPIGCTVLLGIATAQSSIFFTAEMGKVQSTCYLSQGVCQQAFNWDTSLDVPRESAFSVLGCSEWEPVSTVAGNQLWTTEPSAGQSCSAVHAGYVGNEDLGPIAKQRKWFAAHNLCS